MQLESTETNTAVNVLKEDVENPSCLTFGSKSYTKWIQTEMRGATPSSLHSI
jgi:hypothetical protein